MTPIKCAWCGQTLPTTHKDRPKQHLNGGRICLGSGQQRKTHDTLRKAYQK